MELTKSGIRSGENRIYYTHAARKVSQIEEPVPDASPYSMRWTSLPYADHILVLLIGGMKRQQCKISPHYLHLLFRIHLISLPIFATVYSDVPIINFLPSVNLIRHQVFQVTRFFRGLVDGYGWKPGLNDGKLLRSRGKNA